LTTKNVYNICCPYTDGYFRSIFYDVSQILIASEVSISTSTKNDKKTQFYRKICGEFFLFSRKYVNWCIYNLHTKN